MEDSWRWREERAAEQWEECEGWEDWECEEFQEEAEEKAGPEEKVQEKAQSRKKERKGREKVPKRLPQNLKNPSAMKLLQMQIIKRVPPETQILNLLSNPSLPPIEPSMLQAQPAGTLAITDGTAAPHDPSQDETQPMEEYGLDLRNVPEASQPKSPPYKCKPGASRHLLPGLKDTYQK